LIVGDGPLRRRLESDLEQRGLKGQAIFTGAQEHKRIASLIRLFDVALAPYPKLDHAFYFSPLKLFEYLACGIPVVAARLGQIEEIVEDGANGLLYTPGNLAELIQRCTRLLRDSALRSRIGDRAARDTLNNYTWDNNAKRAVDIAQQVVNAKETPWSLGALPTR